MFGVVVFYMGSNYKITLYEKRYLFMKKRVKICKGLSFVMAMCMLFGLNTTFLAADKSARQTEYLEEHYQVNFKDVDYYIVDGKELIIEEEDSRSFWTRNHVQSEIDMLECALDNSSDMKETLIQDLQEEDELMAVSIAEAPVVFVEDHYERIATSEASTYATLLPNQKTGTEVVKESNFYLYTYVSRETSANSDGNYRYTTKTVGYWDTNSFIGGKKYPAAGEDYVLQSTPSGWVRSSNSMTASYDSYPSFGQSGTDFWACTGGENYIKYAILDDPLGWRQNKDFTLVCKTSAPASSSNRMINSYYIHTWDTLTIDVSVSATSNKSVTLDFDPSIDNKSWELYSYVTFSF